MRLVQISESHYTTDDGRLAIVRPPVGRWHLVDVESGEAVECDSVAEAARMAATVRVNSAASA